MTTAIQEYTKTDAALAELAQRFKGMVYDVTVSTGMQDAKAARAEIRGYRVDLEKVRVEIKAPALERCRLIDAEAKRITAVLVELEEPIDRVIKAEEQRKEREAMEAAMAKQRVIDAMRAQVEAMRQRPSSCVGKNAVEIGEILEALRVYPIGAEFGDLRIEAEDVKRAALAQISAMLRGVQAQDEEAERIKIEREELGRLRAAQAERERASLEAMEAEQRAARARIAAEEQAAREARAVLEAEQRAADAARRELQRKESELMDARTMLTTFKARFGHLDEFAAVVAAIDVALPKKARRVA